MLIVKTIIEDVLLLFDRVEMILSLNFHLTTLWRSTSAREAILALPNRRESYGGRVIPDSQIRDRRLVQVVVPEYVNVISRTDFSVLVVVASKREPVLVLLMGQCFPQSFTRLYTVSSGRA